jgi:hypothetical protein
VPHRPARANQDTKESQLDGEVSAYTAIVLPSLRGRVSHRPPGNIPSGRLTL